MVSDSAERRGRKVGCGPPMVNVEVALVDSCTCLSRYSVTLERSQDALYSKDSMELMMQENSGGIYYITS